MKHEKKEQAKQSGKPITIDIFLSVVDNYGDIGFATELLLAFEGEYSGEYAFRIFTDNQELVEKFFTKNDRHLPQYQVLRIENSSNVKFSSIILLLFHFPIPSISDEEQRMILRIDYLSFDPIWTLSHGQEHVLSTSRVPIIEIIPSFLPSGAGVLHSIQEATYSRSSFLEKNALPKILEAKKWVSIFAYSETFEKLDFAQIPTNIIVFILGNGIEIHHPQIVVLPFLSIEAYHTLLSLADMNLIRGEVSAVAAMQVGKPFLWDMYKGHGGFPREMSEHFLDFFAFSQPYRQLHQEFNTEKNKIQLEQMIQVLEQESYFQNKRDTLKTPSLIKTLKKYIDRIYFSL